MSSGGFDAVKTQNKKILSLYNSKKGTGGPKAAFGDVQYMNEIVKKERFWTPEKAYAVGGVRVQSFSDYIPRMVFDYAQMVYDLAATKLPAHAYTKESLFAKQFGLTGIKINMSLIPAVADGGIAAGLDANGNYVWAGESFNYDDAVAIQNADGYTENCGTICVGVSDLHIRKLLNDPNIRMVIPYHKSGLNPIVAHMNRIAAFTDYTGSQNTLDRNGSKLSKDFDFNAELHKMGQNADPKAVIQKYLDWCDSNGYTPKFSQFRDHPNYYKLIEDFTLYDRDGSYVPQREVRAVFPSEGSAFGSMKELIKAGLEEDAVIEGKRDEALSSIVDEIERTIPKTEAEIPETEVKQADRDLEAQTEYEVNVNHTTDSGIRFSPRDISAVPSDINVFVDKAITNAKSNDTLTVSYATQWDNQSINRLGISWKGKYTNSERNITSRYVRHILNQHGNAFIEALRGQLHMDGNAIKIALSNLRAGKGRVISGTSSVRGNPTIVTEIPINGYTLYAEEPLAILNGTELEGRTMYIKPTSTTALIQNKGPANIPQRRGGLISSIDATGRIVNNYLSDPDGKPTEISYLSSNGIPYSGNITYGVVVMSTDTDALNTISSKMKIEKANVKVKNPYIVTSNNPIITDEDIRDGTVSDRIKDVKAAGYDSIIMDYRHGDNYFVMVFDKSNVVEMSDRDYHAGDQGYGSFSERTNDSISNRSLLANAFESVAQNDYERKKIQEYKKNIDLLDAEERKLGELNAQIKELSFAKGPRDGNKIQSLRDEATKTANRINTLDRALLKLEASKPLQDVLNRERKKAYQKAEQKGKAAMDAYKERVAKTQRELIDRYQQSRKNAVDSRNRTAMRHKIQNTVKELNDYLLHGTKDRHVPIELQKAVAEALDAVNMDTVGAEERIKKLEAQLLKAKTPEQIQEISRKIDHVREMGDNMSSRLKALKNAYDEIVNSDDPLIANSYDNGISAHMMSLIVEVGETPLRDMTMSQLEIVHDVYQMVLTTIRNANKAFKAAKSENISILGNRVMMEIEKAGGKKRYRIKGMEGISSFLWNDLKPVYAFEAIGSDTFKELFNNVRKGEDVWAVDVEDAKQYYLAASKKYGYDSWDFKKRYTFTSSSGMDFSLTIDQIMSLYAFSKREQAKEHLKKGGIVFDDSITVQEEVKIGPFKTKANVEMTDSTAYNISDEVLSDIISKLTKEQKGFVDEMQDYLSTVMGNKGNEVSLEMYGIKLFKEKNYFPLKSAQQFMAKAKEQAQGDVKIKNSGFSKDTAPKASNPIVLSSFMDVWANHVNDMSMYHAFVLPMEDFYRVYNYKTPVSDTMATESVEMFLQNAYGKGATRYIDQLLRDLNGGARSDPNAGVLNKMMGKFKKGAVFASLSVFIQQPSAIARATALIDTKYFIGPKVDKQRHDALWSEVKKYAPVALIKEMGYFDTNMGKSTVDYITSREYSGIGEKAKALVTDSGYRDEFLSKAPALADEYTWCAIWEAAKRETKAKNPGMDIKSEAFLKKAGERFTEVIVKTQVYDSVLSRSGMMRSKDSGMKMLTAFMAEPTTSINMIADALIQGKRGNVRYARKAIGGVIGSVILNSILVSFVYAARDDDDDKTYWEKYLTSFTSEMLEGMNPATYIPFIKDIVSIVQGYDVERSDMSVISDVWKAYQRLNSGNLSTYRKVEDFVGGIAKFFGLPVKNMMRDARAIYQTVETFINGQQTTKAGVGYAVKEALPEFLGGGAVSNQQQLYEAYLSGDKTQISRVEGRYKDQNAVHSAIRKALRENDSRIHEAAQARIDGDLNKYTKLAKEIIAEGHFVQDDVVAAINSEINAINSGETTSTSTSKASGLYNADDFAVAIANGDSAMANAIKVDIIQTAQKNGKTAEEAEKSFATSARTAVKETFLADEMSESQAVDALVTYCDKTEDEAVADVQYWKFKQEYPDVYADDAWFDTYYEKVADSGIGIDVYMNYRNAVADITGEGKKERRMEVIDSLPISVSQKDALYLAEGWAESKLYEAPWH